MIKQHKIPTILGILVLFLALGGGVFLVQQGQTFFSRAAPETSPTQVKITNMSDRSFSISWITQKETVGFVKIGKTNSLEQIFSDDRDQASGSTGSFTTHHITIKNLDPQTLYFFKIGSGGKLFDNNGKPYEITTAQKISISPPASDVVSGTILGNQSGPAEGAIVYLSVANTTPQSTLVRPSGTWFIPLNTSFSANLTDYAQYDKRAQVEELFIQGGKAGTATAINTTANDNPTPEITLGESHDFRQELPPEEEATPPPIQNLENEGSSPSSQFSIGGINPPTLATDPTNLNILNPDEGETINTQKPEFVGTGPQGKEIQILVESPLFTGSATSDINGDWAWTPPDNLPPGEHKITITYLDTTLSRNFTVLAAGTEDLPAFTSTPSATVAPSPTPTPDLNPTPTSTDSGRTSMPSTDSGVPTSGNLTPTFLLFIMGLISILGGLMLKPRF